MTPIAIELQSVLLGYFVSAAIFYFFGFRMGFWGLGAWFGWKSDKEAIVSAATAASLILILVLLRIFGIKPYYLRPFVSPIYTLGSNIMFLGLHIHCHNW